MSCDHVNRRLPSVVRAVLKRPIAWYLRISGRLVIDDPSSVCERLGRAGVLIISNHASYLDSLYLICTFRQRLTICGAKPQYFTTAARRAVTAIGNVLRVESKEQFLTDCSTLLAARNAIVIYPEMSRYPDGLGPFKTWAAEVALKNAPPVVPCFIAGSGSARRRSVAVSIGKPFCAKGTPARATADFRRRIQHLQKRMNQVSYARATS